ncbi:MAG: TadA family conjugal transfer-associated ATPase [Mycobacteriales bacterium]
MNTDDVEQPLIDRVRRRLADGGGTATPAQLTAAMRAERAGPRAYSGVRAEIDGAGPLAPLLDDPAVTDVLVNGPDDVWIDRGGGLERSAVRFDGEPAVRRLAQRLAAACGRRLDDAQPWVDARTPDGTRVHAVLPPISAAGTCLSLRVLRSRAFTLDELVAAGTVDSRGAALLAGIVAARLAFLVTGGTGAGKTTLLASLLGLVPPEERIVLVEDASELRPAHPHVVRLEARRPNVEGAGEVTLRDLVRQALRMRPDRLVVGEVRGAEVVDLLAALNTGHEGGAGTLHANSPADVPARLAALGALGGLPQDALSHQLTAAVQVVIHIRRRRDGRRVITEISLLTPDPQGRPQPLPAWRPGTRPTLTLAPTPSAPTPSAPDPNAATVHRPHLHAAPDPNPRAAAVPDSDLPGAARLRRLLVARGAPR